MIDEIQKLLSFVEKFKQIERALYNPGQDRQEKVFHPKLKLDVIHEEKRTKIKDPDILEIWNQIYEEFKLDKHSYWKTVE